MFVFKLIKFNLNFTYKILLIKQSKKTLWFKILHELFLHTHKPIHCSRGWLTICTKGAKIWKQYTKRFCLTSDKFFNFPFPLYICMHASMIKHIIKQREDRDIYWQYNFPFFFLSLLLMIFVYLYIIVVQYHYSTLYSNYNQ